MTKNKIQDYDSICVELDRLSILMLDAMKEYIDCKIILENYIKTGSLHLAKARYIMGNKNVSSLQLPTEDCDVLAQTRVSHSKQKNGSTESLVFEINRLSIEDKSDIALKHRGQHFKDNYSDNTSNESKKTRESKKHQSDKKGVNGDSDTKDSEDKATPTSGRVLTMSKDPMKWFGVLVPQNLKHAQANFSTALEYIVQCANIQAEMESIRSKYTHLMKLKQEFVVKPV